MRWLKDNYTSAYLLMLAAFTGVLLLAVSAGSVAVPLSVSIKAVLLQIFPFLPLSLETEAGAAAIIQEVRLPRVLLASAVGGALGLAGAVFQGLLRNPLADPYTLGVSSGSSLGAVAVLYFGWQIPLLGGFTLPAVSIICGFLTLAVLLLFVYSVERAVRTETMILAGIIITAFLSAFMSLLIAFSGEELRQIIQWLLGSVSRRGWDYFQLIVPCLLAGVLLLLPQARALNAFAFGEDSASSVGVNVPRTRLLLLIGASVLTGGAVAVSGTIGFVGLVIPHMIRLLWGPDHKHLLPLSFGGGAVFLMLADLIARTAAAPAEVPVGVITALAGAPVFALLLFYQRRRRWQ
ncbi:iron complex transport system permease protein [Marinococcus luteus]|uniref:Iron complex transport system permease protein n=1 Tax=Marinococcus luteus TaxID=1122204 RepID=A0A1H2RH13_9BACI|nr:iron ABC transporter permease [Marinococcus luteus]SDW17939.1 iron complex transport system permease protein [Marinococcus luteus]